MLTYFRNQNYDTKLMPGERIHLKMAINIINEPMEMNESSPIFLFFDISTFSILCAFCHGKIKIIPLIMG